MTSKVPFVAPEDGKQEFNCPLCSAYAKQTWYDVSFRYAGNYSVIDGLKVAFCSHCGKYSVWIKGHMIFPSALTAPDPHPDMPAAIRADYEEARSVFSSSSRSSSALLRLCIQKLCGELGCKGKNLNDDIGELVKKGMPVEIQQALDVVRVVGNNQVHPGTLDVRDDPHAAGLLFELVNMIVDSRIAQPKRVAEMFEKLPAGAREAIAKRDGAMPSPPAK